ncbi:MAG: hypothetical protein BGO30_06395 [Bacteroidetes bacterium 41-46]|nr:MAG: hypothetical protein BGO30_06395 [Bacteroidetes bacterium 41-46]
MKRDRFVIAASVILIAFLLQSCGPVIEIFNVDQRIPAEFNVDFSERTITVFSSTDELKDSSYISRFESDSLIMINMALGIAEGLEANLFLDTGSVKVFNHTEADRANLDNPAYVRGLSFNSSSDLLFIVESLEIGSMQLYKVSGERGDGNAGLTYVSLPFIMDVGLYDGISGAPLLKREVADTIYWEVITKMDLNDEIVASRLYSSMYEISKKLGYSFTSRFFDTWLPVERYLYSYVNGSWGNAYRLSQEFKWREAMEIWMSLTESAVPVKKASAAFNVAVALEMMEQYALALEWLDVAEKSYPLKGLDGYKSILKERLEKK